MLLRELYSNMDIEYVARAISKVRKAISGYSQIYSMGTVRVEKGDIQIFASPIGEMDESMLAPIDVRGDSITVIQFYDNRLGDDRGTLSPDGEYALRELMLQMSPCILWDPHKEEPSLVERVYRKKTIH
jgi:hypothetical protein